MLEHAPLVVVLCAGLFLLVLGLACLLRPGQAARFLAAFASTPAKHALELILRLIAGAAFVAAAPSMAWPAAFAILGWVLIATTVALALVPWKVHRALAGRVVPRKVAHLRMLGIASLAAAGVILASAAHGAG